MYRSRISALHLALMLSLPVAVAAGDENWPQFRGANSLGTVEGETSLPDTWSTTENVEWKTDIPGRGWSSPVVWGDKIFLTTVVNLGETEEIKKGLYFGGERGLPDTEHEWYALCLDLETGDEVWRKKLHEGIPQTSIHLKCSYASETPVTDGEHIYVMFGGTGVYCLNMDGDIIWERPITARKTRFGWGYAASPVLYKDRLYVLNDNEEESYLMALDKDTGEQVWRTTRSEKTNWATPYIWENDQRTELIVPATERIVSYDLDGNELWQLSGMSSITIATPYENDGLLIVSSGYVGDADYRPIYAIRPGASGDITLEGDDTSNEFIAWSQPKGAPYNPSTVVYNGIIYVLYDFGFMAAYDATDGSEVFSRKRIPRGRAFTSSPWAYNGKIFCLNEDGVTFVLNASNSFEIIGKNELAEDDMGMATPAIVGDRLLIRTASRLYSIKDES